jgi:hypothetical protein
VCGLRKLSGHSGEDRSTEGYGYNEVTIIALGREEELLQFFVEEDISDILGDVSTKTGCRFPCSVCWGY